MNEQYQKSFTPFDFKNGLSTKNRVVMAPMTTWSSNDDYTISDEEIKYYENRVSNLGLVITGCTPVMPNGIGFTNEFAAYDDSFIPSLTRLANAAKSGHSKAILQIFHAGNKTLPQLVDKKDIVSASSIQTTATAYVESLVPRALSEEEILEIIKAFGETTKRAIKAGFDGVELHGAHGFLLQNFLSPHYNQRDDYWGGSLQNRMRFALSVVDEVISVINEYAEKPFILGYRFSPDEPEKDGLKMEDTYGLIDELIKKKIDYIHASLPNILTSKPFDMQNQDQTYVDLLVSHVNHRIPLMAAGSLSSPEEVEASLAKGLDFAAVGHGIILNPDWIEKSSTQYSSTIQKSLSVSHLEDLHLPKKLWNFIQSSDNWFDIVE